MLRRVISGGQTGADQGGLRAARACDLTTGGTAPALWLVESADGRGVDYAPWLTGWGLVEYQDVETRVGYYNFPQVGPPPATREGKPWRDWCGRAFRARTIVNVLESHGTVWFGSTDSRGFSATSAAVASCKALTRKGAKGFVGTPFKIVSTRAVRPYAVAEWIMSHEIVTLNVAGNRESVNPGIGGRTEAFLVEVFRYLKEWAFVGP